MNRLTAILFMIAEFLLKSVSNILWNSLFEVALEGIAYAEEQFDDGQAKKDYVMEKINEFLANQKFNFIQAKIIELAISRIVDNIIAELNDKVGNDWETVLKEYERKLADNFDFID